jgi:hypothetical protein
VKNRYTFNVSKYLKKTRVKIDTGDVVQITASGKIILHGVPGSAGPEGVDDFTDRCIDPVFPYGALLYKIGYDDWNMVDPDNAITADKTGYLKLTVNDNHPSNNRGMFTVNVTVTSSKINGRHQLVKVPAPQKAEDNIAPIPHSTAVPKKARDNIQPIPHSTAVPQKTGDNIQPIPHSTAVTEKAKGNILPIQHSTVVQEKAKDNIQPTPHLTAGILTLSQLQLLSTNSANAAKAFLTAKHFRVDAESSDLTNKYNFSNNDVSASIIKYVKENQASLSTSSALNYEVIKASLHNYEYTPRELVTKAEGVTKFANSRYSISIVLFKLNNKPQYIFVVKRL